MVGGTAKRVALLVVVAFVSALAVVVPAAADGADGPAYDISWPQCPDTYPEGGFSFAVIGLTGGRPFTTNECFRTQYAWAQTAQSHPDVYINLDFPKAGRRESLTGPYGVCDPADDWCRGYNWGFNLAKDSIRRAAGFGVTPGRYWLDVEQENYWSDDQRNNAQVVRGALDYFLDFNIPIGIYGTSYQWGEITGGFMAPVRLPLWAAGAEDAEEARARCDDRRRVFAGGEIWLVQYPEGEFDGNVLCPRALAQVKLDSTRLEGGPLNALPQLVTANLSPEISRGVDLKPGFRNALSLDWLWRQRVNR